MRIVDTYSLAGAHQLLQSIYPVEMIEVEDAIAAIDGRSCFVKVSQEAGRGILFSPIAFNNCLLTQQLHPQGWASPARNLPLRHDFPSTGISRRIPLSMDGIKNSVGVESQLGK